MKRIEGWESLLNDFIKSRYNNRFEWGQHDCCLFVYDGIEAITGEDPAYMFRTKYTDKTGAYKLLKDFASGGLEETAGKLAKEFEMTEVAKTFATRGDIALCNVPTAISEALPTLGIIGLNDKIYIAGTRRLQIFDKDVGVRFWKV